jgi:UPF0755 protein
MLSTVGLMSSSVMCVLRFLVKFVLLLALLAGGLAAGAWWYVHRPLPLSGDEIEVQVERGHTLRQALQAVRLAGADVEPEWVYWIARAGGRADKLIAGSYVLPRGISAWEVLAKFAAGEVSRAELLIVEGWTFRQVRAAIAAHPYINNDLEGLDDREVMARLGVPESHPEGMFFPDTYVFDRRASALAVLRQAYAAMQRRLDQAWAMRKDNLPLKTPYEALILASIIEKETGVDDERQLVASVFTNRLRIGMRLQTDPTVIYGYGEALEGRLRRRHLDTDHEYNTYTRAGLPPTPIAMPGMASLLAAVNPADSDYLYFVARGDGSSQFSSNLADHNRAVNRYQKGGGG